ncbi:hypothetical protein [Clostridium beijerinckii]
MALFITLIAAVAVS